MDIIASIFIRSEAKIAEEFYLGTAAAIYKRDIVL